MDTNNSTTCNFLDEQETMRYELELYRSSRLGAAFTVLVDDNLTLLYGNEHYYNIHEYTKENMKELLNNQCIKYIHPNDLSMVRNIIDDAVLSRNRYAEWMMRIISGKGNIRYILCSALIHYEIKRTIMGVVCVDITKQRKMVESLQINEEKLRLAAENSDVSFWTYYYDNKHIVQTAASKALHGHNEDLYNVPDYLVETGYIREDSIGPFLQMFDKLAKGAKTASGDFWFRNLKGSGWWCEHVDYTNVFDDRGKPIYAHAVGRDITKLKQAEKRYKDEIDYANATQSDKLLVKVRTNVTKNLVESYIAKNNIGITSEGTTYTKGTEQLASTGYTVEEQEKIRIMLNRDRVLKAFADGETVYSIEYQRKINTGQVIWVRTTVKTFINPETNDIMSFMYTYDINEERLKEGIIKAVSSLEHDFIFYLNLETEEFRMYLGNEKMVDVPPLSGNNYTEMFTALNKKVIVPIDVERSLIDLCPNTIRENLKEQRVFSSIYGVYDKEGTVRQKRFQYAYLEGRTNEVVITRSDVTELFNQQRQQQEMLETALLAAQQASSAKSDFLSRMSHEIRTPMNAIIGMSTIAAQSIGDDAQIADCISKIGISSRFLLSLINDILDMSRIESGKVLLKNETIPFQEFISGINSICYSQAKTKNIDYENIVDVNIEDFYVGDAMKLQQVIINILSNAIKFTPNYGKVSLSVCQAKKHKNDAVIRFIINDNGCGIDDSFIPHIFEPFVQEHTGATSMYGGTGLGLAICKSLVDMMDGTISVRSIVGIGTEFVVDVKLGISEDSKKRKHKTDDYNFKDLKALVVDDDVVVCEQAVITLNEIGVKSEWVDSGRKAIDKVQVKWNKKEYYDLVIIDWKMPEMDGIETARRIRQIVGPEVTIIIMTAYDWTIIEHEAKLAGVNILMNKPMFKSTLISTFQRAFGGNVEEKELEISPEFIFENKRVLLAEDHPLNVEVATKLLQRRGFIVEHAPNGVAAVEMYAKNTSGYYDAVLMDIRMPQMDGLQATNTIRHMSKEGSKTIPIIAMTANAFDDDIQKSKAAGMNAHLAKPIDPQQLFQTLYDYIYRLGEDLNEDH
ncbi:MAG: response regulator [Erysipelotrichaceae bacterium]